MSPPLNRRIHPVKLTLKSNCIRYHWSNGTASQQMWLQRWAMRQFDLSTTELLENQPAALPPLQGNANPIYYTGPQLVCLKNSERVSARKLLINRYVYSLETVHPKASVSHSCICVRMCVNYNLGKDTTWEKSQRWRVPLGITASSCLSGVAAQ